MAKGREVFECRAIGLRCGDCPRDWCINWKKGQMTKLVDDMRFEDLLKKLKVFRASLLTCEAELTEDAKGLRRLFGFMNEALGHFRLELEAHSVIDLK